MGNDVNDLGCMAMVGYACAPADARPEALAAAAYVSPYGGGRGAVRDVCERIIAANAAVSERCSHGRHGDGGLTVNASSPAPAGRSVLILADSDSQIFGTMGLARAFAGAGYAVTYGLFSPRIPENARALAADQFTVVDLEWPDLMVQDQLAGYDAIGVYSFGSRIQRFREWFGRTFPAPSNERPVLFTGFNGLILEKFEEGVAWRAGYDLVAVGGTRDEEIFRQLFRGTPIADQPIIATGLGFANVVKRKAAEDGRRSLVFAEQSVIPRGRGERLWLLGQLSRIARNSPNWDVIVKVRAARGEKTFHKVKDHMEDLLYRLEPVPANLIVSSGSLAESLKTANLMLTVSSTAVFEALRSEIPVATVGDLGISIVLGTHVFLGSDLVVQLSDIKSLDDFVPPVPAPAWLARMGVTFGGPHALVEAIRELRRDGRPLPPPYYGPGGAMPVPVNIAFVRSRQDARELLREGRLDEAREAIAVACELRPDDFVSQLYEQAASRRISVGSMEVRAALARIRLALNGLVARLSKRPLRRLPAASRDHAENS